MVTRVLLVGWNSLVLFEVLPLPSDDISYFFWGGPLLGVLIMVLGSGLLLSSVFLYMLVSDLIIL